MTATSIAVTSQGRCFTPSSIADGLHVSLRRRSRSVTAIGVRLDGIACFEAGCSSCHRGYRGRRMAASHSPDQDRLADIYDGRFTEEDLQYKRELWQVLCADYFQRLVPR